MDTGRWRMWKCNCNSSKQVFIQANCSSSVVAKSNQNMTLYSVVYATKTRIAMAINGKELMKIVSVVEIALRRGRAGDLLRTRTWSLTQILWNKSWIFWDTSLSYFSTPSTFANWGLWKLNVIREELNRYPNFITRDILNRKIINELTWAGVIKY